MSTTTAPAVLAALVAKLPAVLPGFQVGNAALFRTLADDVVVVGFVPDGAAIEATQALVDMGALAQESYDVHSVASSRRPMASGADFTTVQAQVFAAKDAVEDFLLSDPTLGGLVMQAYLSAWTYTPDTTDDGVVADLSFTVHVEAFRS